MVSLCWVTRTSEMEAGRVSDQTYGLVFGRVPEWGREVRNWISALEETRNRLKTTAYELVPELVAEETLKDLDPGKA